MNTCENIERNVDLVENLHEIAKEKNYTLPQLVLAPLLGASRLAQFEESVKARDLQLSEDDVRRIDAAVPKDKIAGTSFRKMEFKNGRIERVS